MPRSKLSLFRETIWDSLPEAKYLAGKEAVFDLVTIALQEWPDESFAQIAAENTKNKCAVENLLADMKRIFHLCAGDENFEAAWNMFMRPLVYEVILSMHGFWRSRRANRLAMKTWRLALIGEGRK